ncbi:amino acid adenylation domain-containing protein [Streptomyces sp. NPDC088746]|uniref:non-ribosomal peptide synthetase n=1 Tax=Streptomyces sp. NPDC088746 TaxID=3365885 RepID=UPI0037F25E9A
MTTSAHPACGPFGPGPRPGAHPSHHVVRCLRIEGVFDPDTAHGALRLLTERHAVLRTVLEPAPAGLVPTPASEVRADFQAACVSREDAIEHAVRAAAEPFDLAHGPLLRLRALRITDREWLLLAVAHRLALDPATLDAFIAEHALAYTAARRNTAVMDTAVADTTEAASVWPTADEVTATLEYWRRRLADLPVLDLPTDLPRPSRPSRTGAVERFTLEAGLTDRLRALSGESGGHSALYAGVAVLLARLTGQRAIPLLLAVPSTVVPGTRIGRPETDVVLIIQLEGTETFQELAGRIEAELGQARTHAAALPPGSLADTADGCGDSGRRPVPVRCAARTSPAPAAFPEYDGVRGTPVPVHPGTSARDLSFTFDLRDGTTHGVLEYDTGLFEPVTARRMPRRLACLLAAAAENPQAQVTALPVLPPEEREFVVSEWNRTARDFPRDRTTASLFEEQVRRDPDAIAVVHEDLELTYGALNTRANRLAHRLIDLGVGPDVRVGLCLSPSVDMMVSLLGILKAGGAYLPLDPEHPAQRLAHVVQDAGARAVLTDTAHARTFAATSAQVLCLDAPDPTAAGWPATDPRVPSTAEHLAYVIYTSGSTGTPKGVAVTHRALSRLVKNADYARFGPGEVHLQLSPLTFDASLLELWGSLLNGGTLVLPPSGLPFPDRLKASLQRHRITTLLLISPQLHVAAEQFPEELARVGQLLVGGDVLSPASAAHLLPYLDDTRFLHVYGPTECTLFATWKPIEAKDTERPTIPIGRPLANTQAYVLDQDLSPLPVGVVGGLWLGGDGLAREYLGRPDLTGEHFLPDPFGPPDSRIYRTGDLARWLADGNLEFCGRSDDQAKIRGYRIELGEVDAALAAHPGVQAVATVVRDDAPGGRALVAYMVGDACIGDADLREHLGSRVPSYMIPATFVRLDQLPLTANGKVDRKALPTPEFGRTSRQQGEPRTPLEDSVLAVIAETLGLDDVGPHDDFFELGGNSLLMVDLFSRLEKLRPDSGLGLTDLLDHRTGRRISALLQACGADA